MKRLCSNVPNHLNSIQYTVRLYLAVCPPETLHFPFVILHSSSRSPTKQLQYTNPLLLFFSLNICCNLIMFTSHQIFQVTVSVIQYIDAAALWQPSKLIYFTYFQLLIFSTDSIFKVQFLTFLGSKLVTVTLAELISTSWL